MSVEWLDENQKSLGTFTYALDMVLEKGLEGKENYLLYAKEDVILCVRCINLRLTQRLDKTNIRHIDSEVNRRGGSII